MGDENPIRTLGDYSRPSHEGYRNTIELLEGKNVVPLRSDTIRLVQNGCSFHGLRSEDPNQHHDFLKTCGTPLVLDVANKEELQAPWSPRHSVLHGKSQASFIDYASSRTDEAGVKKYSKDTNHPQKDQPQLVTEIRTQRREEPEQTLEDEFKDLHLNLPILEVLAHAPMLGDSEPFDTLADLGACINIIPLYLFKKLNIRLLEETGHVFGLADGTKSYPIGIVRDVEVHIERLKLLFEFYVIDMKKDPETPLLAGRGFLAPANAIIDCRKAKIAVGEGITSSDGVGARTTYYARKDFLDCHFPREWEIARDAGINPLKDVLVFRRMVEFLRAIPINLKINMWESEDLIKSPINWDEPPKNKDGAWHAKIRLIDPDGKEFTKTLQSVPTSYKLSEREDPREIIDLGHFYDTLYLMRKSLEVLRKFHWMILEGRFNQLSHVSSPLLSKPGEY
ncbi:MAK10-like protein [Tanacetum coccineum]